MSKQSSKLSVGKILAFLRKLNKHLRSRPVRAEVRNQSSAVQKQHDDLIWELNLLISKLSTMELADINEKLSVYNDRYIKATDELEKELEDLSKLRLSLNKAEKIIGVIARTALLFA